MIIKRERIIKFKISDFQLPPTAELAKIADKIKDSRELIDYCAIDWITRAIHSTISGRVSEKRKILKWI